MDFKKFAADASSAFNRAKQYTEEQLGRSEKTELDAHYENLLQRADKTKQWTERILKGTEAILQPNPNVRMQEFLYERLEKKKRDQITNEEQLGQNMVDGGNEFGPGTAYGNALIKCGQAQMRIGLAQKDFVSNAATNFLTPLKNFLEGDMKTVQNGTSCSLLSIEKERKILESKRLDLDVAKNKLKKAKTQPAKEQDEDDESSEPSPEPSWVDLKAEQEVHTAQVEFDRQAEVTRLLLEGISSTHAHHLRCLNDFIDAQNNYYSQCQQYMLDLQRELGSFSLTVSNSRPMATPSAPPAENGTLEVRKKARVLYDYDAGDKTELSLMADELITVYEAPNLSSEWMMGEKGLQRGKVPVTYLQVIDSL